MENESIREWDIFVLDKESIYGQQLTVKPAETDVVFKYMQAFCHFFLWVYVGICAHQASVCQPVLQAAASVLEAPARYFVLMLMPEEVQNALALDTTNHWGLSGTFPLGFHLLI